MGAAAPFSLLTPLTLTPLVLDSPHSGQLYPADFAFICPKRALQQSEDLWVEALFADAPALGVALLHTHITRNYIDLNRAITDINPSLCHDRQRGFQPTFHTAAGHGLIRDFCQGLPVYGHRLAWADIEQRLTHCYHPYHNALKTLLGQRQAHYGAVWHLNCHSMPSTVLESMPDFVLGDKDGLACEPAFTEQCSRLLQAMGYRVLHNTPYKGGEILHRYGKPAKGFHSLQCEINRALYMDETTLQPHAGFAVLQRDLKRLLQALRDWALDRSTLMGDRAWAAQAV